MSGDRRRLRHRSVAALVLVLVMGACGGGAKKAERAIQSTTTEQLVVHLHHAARPRHLSPHRGPATRRRQAPAGRLVVKIDNVDPARPQAGLDAADIVFEEMVESRLTRLIAVFQSADAPRVGPVRSTRTTDIDIVSALNHPLYGYSGGNAGFVAQLRGSPVIDVGADTQRLAPTIRSGPHLTPHNLYTSTAALSSWRRPRARTPPHCSSTGARVQAVTGGRGDARRSPGRQLRLHGGQLGLGPGARDLEAGPERLGRRGAVGPAARGRQRDRPARSPTPPTATPAVRGSTHRRRSPRARRSGRALQWSSPGAW